MIDTFQIATQGIGPGWSTFGFATQGFGFEVEVVVRPVQGGGGGGSTPWYPGQYEVIIRVKRKGKVWEERRFVSAMTGKTLEKIIASFKRIYHLPIRVKVSEVTHKVKNIIINVFSKDNKYHNKQN